MMSVWSIPHAEPASPAGAPPPANALARDYWPGFSRPFRHPLTILAMAAVASLLCGLTLHPRGLVVAAATAVVGVVGVVWPWISVRGLTGTLTFDRPRAVEGDEVAVRMAIRNRLPWAAWGLCLRDGLDDEPDEEENGHGVPGIAIAPGRTTAAFDWRRRVSRRGVYPAADARIASGFPFGLREASRPLDIEDRLLVWPRTFPVGPIPEAATGPGGDGSSPRNKAGQGGELLGVRAYRRGDPPRRIHWPQTARLGELIVCEVHELAVPHVQVVPWVLAVFLGASLLTVVGAAMLAAGLPHYICCNSPKDL